MPVDVLLFGAHPDDIEWGAGGTALLMQQQRISFAIVDLTRGEMGSRGTAAERDVEAKAAADFLGAADRLNLNMADCRVVDTPEARLQIAAMIRRFRPSIVLAPFWEDRHPDHAAAGFAVRNSSLYCAMKKLENADPPHKPAAFLYYLLHNFSRPSFVVDISDVYQRKLQLMRLHESQFSKTAEQFGVVALGVVDYLFGLESRDRFFGSLVGVQHGEALVTDSPVRLNGLNKLLDAIT